MANPGERPPVPPSLPGPGRPAAPVTAGLSRVSGLAARHLGLLWLTGFDLRITVLAIPPLLPELQRTFGLSLTGLAALTTLPLLLLAVAAPLGSALTSRLGPRRTVVAALAVVAGASALRGLGTQAATLFLLTAVMGVAIAAIQPTLPALVRTWLPHRAGFATALYVNGILVGETVGASLTLGLAALAGGWRPALAAWAIPVALTAALLLRGRAADRATRAVAPWLPDWRSRQTWELGLLQGAASVAYFASNTFLPTYLHASGDAHLVVAGLVALNVAQLPASLTVAALPTRFAMRAGAVVGLSLIVATGVALLLVGSAVTVVLGAALIGFGTAWTFIVTVTLPALLVSPGEAARVSAGMFTIGYTMAFVLPVLGGAAADLTGTPATGFLPVLLASCIMLALAPALRRHAHA